MSWGNAVNTGGMQYTLGGPRVRILRGCRQRGDTSGNARRVGGGG